MDNVRTISENIKSNIAGDGPIKYWQTNNSYTTKETRASMDSNSYTVYRTSISNEKPKMGEVNAAYVSNRGEDHKGESQPKNDTIATITGGEGVMAFKGLSYKLTSFFMVAQMAGAGFLALPSAMADAGWVGIPMLIMFCGSVGFAASRLGKSWLILEDRWPKQYSQPVTCKQPYMDIASRAFGPKGRTLCFVCVISTLIMYGIMFIILLADMLSYLIKDLSICEWMLVVTAILLPTVFLGTPKDFWQASVMAVIATVITIVVIVTQILRDQHLHPDPQYPNPNLSRFTLGFSAILFSFGGSSVFPTLQNDMTNRRDWWKSVVIAFTVILCLYLPVAVTGYVVIGDGVDSNVLLSVSMGIPVTLAISLNIINLMATFVISFNPVSQAFEDMLQIPDSFNWKSIALRTGLLLLELLIALAIPDFGAILNLIGGSTITILTFILPPMMYLWLVAQKSDGTWEETKIELWEKLYLWIIVSVGVVGGITSTISSLMVIMDPNTLGESCFTNFLQQNKNL